MHNGQKRQKAFFRFSIFLCFFFSGAAGLVYEIVWMRMLSLGIFYTRLGIRFTEAAFFNLATDALQAALTIEPQSYAVLTNLANVFFELGKLDMAAGAYPQVIRLLPNSAAARLNLGLVYEKQGSADLAAGEYEKAITLDPSWRMPRMRLGVLRVESALREKTGGPSFPPAR